MCLSKVISFYDEKHDDIADRSFRIYARKDLNIVLLFVGLHFTVVSIRNATNIHPKYLYPVSK